MRNKNILIGLAIMIISLVVGTYYGSQNGFNLPGRGAGVKADASMPLCTVFTDLMNSVPAYRGLRQPDQYYVYRDLARLYCNDPSIN